MQAEPAFIFLPLAVPPDAPADRLVTLASQFGPVRRRARATSPVEPLRILERHAARPRSLSALHGAGRFPFHSDFAHWRIPPRYVLLAATSSVDARPTEVLIWRDLCLDFTDADNAIFRVRNGQRSFYTPIRNRRPEFMRFDGGCMVPANYAATRFADSFESLTTTALPVRIQWSPGDVLVLDNWAALHARGGSCTSLFNTEARLLRVICGGLEA